MSFTMKALAAAALGLHWSDLCYKRLCYGSVTVVLWLLPQLLHQAGERLCSGCHASQERIHVSAVPVAPQDSFQPLSLHLAHPGFSEQCGQHE